MLGSAGGAAAAASMSRQAARVALLDLGGCVRGDVNVCIGDSRKRSDSAAIAQWFALLAPSSSSSSSSSSRTGQDRHRLGLAQEAGAGAGG
jgi:hypothetical protein